jgi:hypothetical protein
MMVTSDLALVLIAPFLFHLFRAGHTYFEAYALFSGF